jgi:hypothetical protein
MNRARRRVIIAALLVVALAVGSAVGTHGRLWGKPLIGKGVGASTARARPDKQELGAGVAVVGVQSPTGLHAAVASVHAKVSRNVAIRVSKTFEVGPSGPLPRPLTLQLPLVREVAADGLTFVLTSKSATGPWTPLRASVTTDGRHVRVTVNHLSYIEAWRTDLQGVKGELKAFFNGLTSHAYEDAVAPTCFGEAEARQAGYLVTAQGSDSILWCLGMQDGQPVLKTVDNRRYPLLALHTGLPVLSGGSGGTIAQKVARALSPEGALIYPRDEVEFGAELRRGTDADLEVTVGAQAQLLASLDVGVKALVDIVTKFGAKKAGLSEEVIGTILESDACIHSKGSGEMIANCLSAKEIIEGFGPILGVILAPIVTVTGILDYFHGAVNGFLDQFSDRSWAKIVVQRLSAPPFAEFVGEWYVHGANMTIRQDHTGEQSWNAGPCGTEMCEGHAELTFVSNPKGAIYTITKLWYTANGGGPPPAGFPSGSASLVGDKWQLAREAPGLLKERPIVSHLDPLDIQYGNPYWCSQEISAQNEHDHCGA